jgi:type II secretory pathway pseudopilin PulG
MTPSLKDLSKRDKRVLVAAVLLVLAVGAVFLLPSPPSILDERARIIRSGAALRQLHQSLIMYMRENGAAPSHAIALIDENYFSPQLLVDPYSDTGGPATLLHEDARTAAIAATDPADPYYRAGDYWVVRVAGLTLDGRIIAGWSNVRAKGDRWVIFDDDVLASVTRKEWLDIWSTDATARRELGITAIDPPPW